MSFKLEQYSCQNVAATPESIVLNCAYALQRRMWFPNVYMDRYNFACFDGGNIKALTSYCTSSAPSSMTRNIAFGNQM